MYNISYQVDDIFNTVKDLCKIVEFAQTPYSARQKVNIGYLIVSKHPIFRSDLRKWMRKPIQEKTWSNFIIHFQQAHQELRDTETLMSELGYQSANAIVEHIVERLREEEESVTPPTPPGYEIPLGYKYSPPYELPPVYALPEQPPPPPTYDPPAQPLPPPQENAVIPEDPSMFALYAMMQSMKLMHDSMHQSYYQGRGRGRGRAQGRGRGRSGGRGRGHGNQNMGGGSYCHMYGNCAHVGSACRTLGPTHSNDVTFANMMGAGENYAVIR